MTSPASGQAPLPHDRPQVVVGPLLRYVDDTTATVWVETDQACEVEVLGHRAQTWDVHGHHYALVVVQGLEPGSRTPYEVRLDGVTAWPEPGSTQPPSLIRTLARDDRLRLAFGSCRRAAPFDRGTLRTVGADALAALAERMMGGASSGRLDDWPDLLFLAGDQVYADEPSPALAKRLTELHQRDPRRREAMQGGDGDEDAHDEIIDFEEYTWLYHESWRQPAVRWLLSTVPTAMILDDHDLRDDWNSSWSWRQRMTAQPWWEPRVQGALASYWVYQHLGNLSPAELAEDDVYRAVREAGDGKAREAILADFALRSDADPDSSRWSFHRDLGRSRLVVVDSRCSRRLDPADRAIVDDTEWAWFERVTDVDVDHLLIGTSLPVLELRGVHFLEGWNEAVAQGAWGERGKRLGEKIRLAVDFEHWAAFRQSFDAMVRRVQQVAARERPPRTLVWLSGDVHCSYLARADVDGVDGRRTQVYQLTMSPFRNPLQRWVRVVNTALGKRPAFTALGWLARRAGVHEPPITWDVEDGPWYGNGVMTVVLDGPEATVEVEHTKVVGGRQVLERTLTAPLT